MHAMMCTRPNIAHVVGVVNMFMSNHRKDNWEVVKWILRYLRGNSNLYLMFGSTNPELQGYTDADMAGNVD